MRNKDDLPETPDWQLPESRPWDESRCCPTDCVGVCESAQHAVFMHGDDLWLSDTFTLGNN